MPVPLPVLLLQCSWNWCGALYHLSFRAPVGIHSPRAAKAFVTWGLLSNLGFQGVLGLPPDVGITSPTKKQGHCWVEKMEETVFPKWVILSLHVPGKERARLMLIWDHVSQWEYPGAGAGGDIAKKDVGADHHAFWVWKSHGFFNILTLYFHLLAVDLDIYPSSAPGPAEVLMIAVVMKSCSVFWGHLLRWWTIAGDKNDLFLVLTVKWALSSSSEPQALD